VGSNLPGMKNTVKRIYVENDRILFEVQ